MSAKFHVSNYGSFGAGLPRDIDGFCYTTVKGWLSAKMDWGHPSDEADRRWYAAELAAEARAAIRVADRELRKWQKGNC